MAQTTTAINSADAVVEISSDNATYTDISGSLVSLIPAAQQREMGSRTTIDGLMPIVLAGKKQPVQIPLVGVYTPTTGEAFAVLSAIWASSTGTIYIKYYPKGKTAGLPVFASGKSVLVGFQHPPMNSADAAPIVFEATVQAPGFTESVVPTA